MVDSEERVDLIVALLVWKTEEGNVAEFILQQGVYRPGSLMIRYE